MAKIEKLEIVLASSSCEFSAVENKLAKIYRNQRRIYFLLQIITGLLRANITLIDPKILDEEKSCDDNLSDDFLRI